MFAGNNDKEEQVEDGAQVQEGVDEMIVAGRIYANPLGTKSSPIEVMVASKIGRGPQAEADKVLTMIREAMATFYENEPVGITTERNDFDSSDDEVGQVRVVSIPLGDIFPAFGLGPQT